MLKNIMKDEKGVIIYVFVIFVAFAFVPMICLVAETTRWVTAKAEAQVATDAMALKIANDSPLTMHPQFWVDYPCWNGASYPKYRGTERYLELVNNPEGDGRSAFDQNAQNFHVIERLDSLTVNVPQRLHQESYLNQEIPQSLKNQQHFPTIEIEAKYSYTPITPFWSSVITVTKTAQTKNFFDANPPMRQENWYPNACPPPPIFLP